jgi:hypothetical protein
MMSFFTHRYDVICASGQALDQAEIVTFIVCRSIGQTQRHKIMQSVDILGIGDAERQGIGPMHDVRSFTKIDIHLPAKPLAIEVPLLKKLMNVPDMVEMGKASTESIANDAIRHWYLRRDVSKVEGHGPPQINQIFFKQ